MSYFPEDIPFMSKEELRENGIRIPKDATDINVGDTISRQAVKYKLTALVNEFEEILAHIREREVDDSVCGLCEYDGAYIGQSGDWCNECPGFEKDDCFKLSDEVRKEWTEEIIKALPTARPEPQWIPIERELPEVGQTVITQCRAGIIKTLKLDSDGDWYQDAEHCYLSGFVIAWMPLPEPYQKGATP